MVRSTVSKFAFTMIELIFAIVIIAISVMSLPVMIQVTSKGIENNLVQEAIFAASAELMGASAGYWDTNSMSDNAFSHLSRVIDVDGDCNGDRLRPGHIAQPLHRRCVASTSGDINNTSSFDFPNLDNSDHPDEDIFLDTTAGAATADATGYKNIYTSAIDVSPAADTNIKIITATIKKSAASGGDTITRLRMQSANVGEIDYYKKRFF